MEIISNDQQPLNKPKRKPLANPFGNISTQNDHTDEFESLTSPDQPYNHSTQFNRPVLKAPFAQSSYNNNNNNEEELEGSISLGPGDSKLSTKTRDSNNSYAINYGINEPGQASGRPEGGSGSFLSSLMGLLVSGQPADGQQVQEYDEENEPPLLEDLGIDPKLIKMRALSVLKFQKCQQEFVAEADMTGPLALFLIFGVLLLLSGKAHFGYLYGFGMIGTLAVYLLMNLLSQVTRVKLYNTMSILGYCLFPIVILALFNVFFSLVNLGGLALSAAAIAWATLAATNFFQVLLNLDDQKWLIAYPVFLFYVVFVIITIF